MDFELVNQGLSTQPKFIAKLNQQYLVTSGHDQPRYINWNTHRSGKAGMYPWGTDYRYRPSGSARNGGSLIDTKWYSIRVVAVDTRFAAKDGSYKVSNAGPISDAVQVSTPHLTVEWTLPSHPDTGYEPDGTGGLDESDECQERWIYVCESDTEADALLGPWSYVDKVENNTDDVTYSLTAFAAGSDTPYADKYPPPNLKACISAFGRIWGVGGIEYSEGQAYLRNDSESEDVDEVTQTDAQDDVYRYALNTAVTMDVYKGDLLTVTDCDNTGNNPAKAKIVRVADDQSWLEIKNPEGVAESPSGTPSATVIQNHIEADADADWYDGMAGADFRFDSTAEDPVRVEYVDTDAGILMLKSEYGGAIAKDTATDYEVFSEYGLYWSSDNNIHAWPAVNYMKLEGRSMMLAAVNNRILIFTDSDLLVVGIDFLDEGYQIVPVTSGTPSPHSVVTANNQVYYWNGKQFMRTNGQDAVAVGQYRMNNLVELIDEEYQDKMYGVYDHERHVIRWMWTIDGEATNNRGVEVNLQTEDVWPVEQWDQSILWWGYNPSVRRWNLWHAGSDRYTDSGKAYLLEHQTSLIHGGLPDDCETIASVQSVDNVGSGYINIAPRTGNSFTYNTVDATSTKNEGIPFVIIDLEDEYEIHGVIEKMEAAAENTDLYFHSDFDLSDVSVGDLCLIGCIPMYYGIKWVDFDSPRYRHHVYDLDLQIEALSDKCLVAIDWFHDMIDTRVKSEVKFADVNTSKLQFSYKMGKPYIVGFRLRVYGPARFNLQHWSLTWATIR